MLESPHRTQRTRRTPRCLALVLAAWCCGLLGSSAATAAGEQLQVLHWWTSASERKAANAVALRLAAEGVEWQDAVVPGGAGLGAGKVLRHRVLAGDAPEVTQMIGVSIGEAAEMGLLLQLDGTARKEQWARVLFPAVWQLVQHRGHTVAAPIGVHRVNTLFFNKRVLDGLGLAPPRSWAELDALLPALRKAGVAALAQSSEPWQVATLFESLLLADGGSALYRALFQRHEPPAVNDPRFLSALQRLRALQAHMGPAVGEQPWTSVLAALKRGDAAMMLMGDWVKGELLASGQKLGEDFGCMAAPGTAGLHLYSVDSFTMFAKDYRHTPAQEKLARLLVSPAVQAEYNAIKGSVSVRRDADPTRMDACARDSWQAFGQPAQQLVPSLSHRMATDEASKDAIVAELHRYFTDPSVQAADVQRRLGAMFRVLPRPPLLQ